MNGIQREAQWKPDPFDTLTSDLLLSSSTSSTSWHNTQSLNRGSSLRAPPSVPKRVFSSSNTLPSSLRGLDSSSSSSSLSTPSPLASAMLPPPPPVPSSRSHSQEILRSSPNPFLSDPAPPRPNSTNPFTAPFTQQQPQRSLTPDFSVQHQAFKPDLQRTTSAFGQTLIPTQAPAAAAPPTSQLHRTMSLFGTPPSSVNPLPAPLIPLVPTPAPALPAAPPSSLPAAPTRQPLNHGQRWVTFDDDHFSAPSSKSLSSAPSSALPGGSLLLHPQTTLLPTSGFDSDPNWALPGTTAPSLTSTSVFPSLPPPVPSRTAPSNPSKIPDRPSDGFAFPKEFTER